MLHQSNSVYGIYYLMTNHLTLPKVWQLLEAHSIRYKELVCDPAHADTASFCEHYNYSLDQSANTILVTSKKVEPVIYALCVLLGTTKLDVNKKVCELMKVKRASFADAETTVAITGMQIGGVTVFGVTDLPIFVDSRVMDQSEVVMGGGNRSSKLVLHPKELLKLPNVVIVDQLANSKRG